MHAESPINSPADITVSITCSLRPSYLIYVKWIVRLIYSFSRNKLLRRSVLLLRWFPENTISPEEMYDRSGAALAISLLQLIIKLRYSSETV